MKKRKEQQSRKQHDPAIKRASPHGKYFFHELFIEKSENTIDAARAFVQSCEIFKQMHHQVLALIRT